jgi:hypothetical protein
MIRRLQHQPGRCFLHPSPRQNAPHTWDIPLKEIVDLVLKVKAQAYCIEAANPQHEHEWQVWEKVKLPAGKILVPGVVTHCTNRGGASRAGRMAYR